MPLPSSRRAGLRAGRQMQVESAKSRLRRPSRAFHQPFRQAILCRERFETVPYRYTPKQACPVLDTGKDEGNAADGLFSAACQIANLIRAQ